MIIFISPDYKDVVYYVASCERVDLVYRMKLNMRQIFVLRMVGFKRRASRLKG